MPKANNQNIELKIVNDTNLSKTCTVGCRQNKEVIYAEEVFLEPNERKSIFDLPNPEFELGIRTEEGVANGDYYNRDTNIGFITATITDTGIDIINSGSDQKQVEVLDNSQPQQPVQNQPQQPQQPHQPQNQPQQPHQPQNQPQQPHQPQNQPQNGYIKNIDIDIDLRSNNYKIVQGRINFVLRVDDLNGNTILRLDGETDSDYEFDIKDPNDNIVAHIRNRGNIRDSGYDIYSTVGGNVIAIVASCPLWLNGSVSDT